MGLGLGVAALTTSAVASADPSDSGAASSASSHTKAAPHIGARAKTAAAKAHRPSAKVAPTPAPRKSAIAAPSKAAAKSAAAASAAIPNIHADPPLDSITQLRLAVDTAIGQAAGALGYGPTTVDNPIAPTFPLRTMIADALAGLRRATDMNPTNEVPTLDPKQLYEFVTGEVIGDLLPSDADGNPLTYQIAQGPTNGTLVVNANGTYYYKPNHDFAAAGGSDTFVIVADDGQHGETVVPVNVTVAPRLGISESFYLRNYSLAPMKFTGYNGDTDDLNGGPAIGTVIMPGREAGWSVTWYLFSVGSVTPQFSTVGYGATPSNPGYIPAGVGSTYQVTFKTKPRETQCSGGATGACRVDGDRIAILMDKPNTVITLDAADADRIAAVLPGLCADGSDAACSFIAISEVAGRSPVRTVGVPVSNETSIATSYSIAIADQVSQSDTVGVSVKLSGGGLAKLASIINLEITASYSHTWVNTKTFTQTMNVPVGAGRTAWIEGSVPVWKVTGDFTVKLGNSVAYLNGGTFDTPDPNGVGSYVIKDKPLGVL